MHLPKEAGQNWAKTRAGRRSRRIVSFNTVSAFEIDVSGLHVVIDRGQHVSRVDGDRFDAKRVENLWTAEFGSLKYPGLTTATETLTTKIGRGTYCQDAGKFSEVYTVTGRCFTYQGNDITLPGVYNGLYLSLVHADRDAKPDQVDGNKSTVAEVWEAVIHEREEVPTVIALTQRQEIVKNLDLRFGIALRNFRVLRRGSNPCEMDPGYVLSNCHRACYEKELIARVGCRLPFMANSTTRMCNGGKEFRNASLTSIRMVDGRDTTIPAWIPDQCGCPTQCNQDIYSFSIDSRIRTDNISVFRLYYVDMNYEEIQEEYSYEVFALLCDLGGTLGLLLGASAKNQESLGGTAKMENSGDRSVDDGLLQVSNNSRIYAVTVRVSSKSFLREFDVVPRRIIVYNGWFRGCEEDESQRLGPRRDWFSLDRDRYRLHRRCGHRGLPTTMPEGVWIRGCVHVQLELCQDHCYFWVFPNIPAFMIKNIPAFMIKNIPAFMIKNIPDFSRSNNQ
ncbi:unnamed protein product [Darwinula stevensoni]|uniref:Uncharacterized protein n=1 Tax=Darwinula stevensoni TaxID=69355 RepID=A0A7R8X699_9CRUS|nr:unnamed protein product [Darwinula stevensoni]CAG0885678.1 unnamed protein product [Darwinula stevensoni]